MCTCLHMKYYQHQASDVSGISKSQPDLHKTKNKKTHISPENIIVYVFDLFEGTQCPHCTYSCTNNYQLRKHLGNSHYDLPEQQELLQQQQGEDDSSSTTTTTTTTATATVSGYVCACVVCDYILREEEENHLAISWQTLNITRF